MKGVIKAWNNDDALLEGTGYKNEQEIEFIQVINVILDLYEKGLNLMLLHSTNDAGSKFITIMVDDRSFR